MGTLEKTAIDKHRVLQTQFHRELSRYSNQHKSRRGTVLGSARRGINTAKSHRTGTPLEISEIRDIQRLKALANGARVLGKGLIVLEGASRVIGVSQSYRNGENWQRKASQEAVGFSTGVIAGTTVGKFTVAATTLLLGATPAGWVIAIAGGLMAGYFAGSAIDSVGKEYTGRLWDWSAE